MDIVRPCGDGWEVLNSAAAKEMRAEWEREGPDNRLFDACFRIQREASEAAGRYIPLIVENVRGAIPWVGKRHVDHIKWLTLSEDERMRVGRSSANFGSFHLWGDVGMVGKRIVSGTLQFGVTVKPMSGFKGGGGSWLAIANNTNGHSKNPVHELTGKKGTEGVDGAAPEGTGKTSWFFGKRADPRDMRWVNGQWVRPDGTTLDGTKIGGDWFSDPNSTCRKHGSRSQARKMASAQIAKIPLPLAKHIASVYFPRSLAQGFRLESAAGNKESDYPKGGTSR